MDRRALAGNRDVAQALGLSDAPPPRRLWYRLTALGIAIALVVAGIWWWRASQAGPEFRTEAVRRGDLTVTVTATGTLEPSNQVEVGSEISGRIASIQADFNDRVDKDQTLAVLDTDELRAKVSQSQAGLDAAEAGVREAMATVDEMRAKARRVRALAQRDFSSQQDLEVAEAATARAEAALASAKAEVDVARAVLEADRTTLEKAVIRSPIDGIVIGRNVEAGQTVAASFQTPILFTLAQDLTQMELHLDVDEADVGQVDVGQEVSFRVDAYPDQDFAATITSVRYAPRTVQGVVTYEAIGSVGNDSLKLRPGMTATADIVTARHGDVVLVPNGALRFTPETAESEPAETSASRTVWTLRGGLPVAIPLRTGATDGRWTMVGTEDTEIRPGLPLIVDRVAGEGR